MSTHAHESEPEPRAALDPEYGSPTTLLVYLTVAISLAISLGSLLFADEGFDVSTAALALLVIAPYLLYARLALARPGVEAVIGGVVLLALGSWGAVDAALGDGEVAFVRLSLMLVVLQLAIFFAGALLRVTIPRRDADPVVDGDEPD